MSLNELKKNFSSYGFIVLILMVALAVGCGGGSSGSSDAVIITGTVTAGPIEGGALIVKGSDGTTIAGPVSVTNGSFSVTLPGSRLSSDMFFECSGGTFTDEATNTAGVAAGSLSAHVAGGALSSGSSVHITPASTIVRVIISGGHTAASAQGFLEAALGFQCDASVEPVADGSGSDSQNLAGLRAAAFSQLTSDLSLTPEDQFDLLAAIAEDIAADGLLDGSGATVFPGSMTSLPEDMSNRFARALLAFNAKGPGLAGDKIGRLPFSKVALSDTYRWEYLPGMMEAMEGRTSFTIKVSDLSNGDPVSGLSLSLSPVMHMASMNHNTPVGAIVDNGDGTYSCTLYYLMASYMSGGTTMGWWELGVAEGGGESVTFHPSVMMAMGDTRKQVVRNLNDTLTMMMSSSPRNYYLFNEKVTASSFTVFIAAREGMMSHPAVYPGVVLNSGTSDELTVSTMAVEVSADGGFTWAGMTHDGGGYWTASGLNLSSGSLAVLEVGMTINGNTYVDNGDPGTGSNAAFTVTVP